MSLNLYLTYLAACVVLVIVPGPTVTVIIANSLRYGTRTGLLNVAGTQLGLAVMIGIVILGLASLLEAIGWWFEVLRLAGAAYLIWLGVHKWRALPQAIDASAPPLTLKGLFVEGLLVNLTNPKAIVFIAALTPQFVDPARPQALQFLLIGLTMCSVDTLVMSCYALLAARLGRWLHAPRAMRAQNRVFGGIFVGAGMLLASSGHY